MKLLYLLFFALLFPLYHFCEWATGGFSIYKITLSLPPGPDKTPSGVLAQKFHFFAQGGQCFAFVSDDNKYVLKLLYAPFAPDFLLKLPLPDFVRQKILKRAEFRAKKWRRDSQSYVLAHEELFEDSGLLAVHLGTSKNPALKTTIIDKLGIQHSLDLNKHAFILQKKAELLFPYIKKHNFEEAKLLLKELVDLLKSRMHKGIHDHDACLHKNIGVVQGKPIFLDIGRFKRTAGRNTQKDLHAITRRLHAFLQEQEPKLAEYLDTLVTP